jgi:hypothetical protein
VTLLASSDPIPTIEKAMEGRLPIAFRYLRPDGKITRHNAVYPRKIEAAGAHQLLHAYCHFTKDVRTFRLDRIQGIRLGSSRRVTLAEAVFAGVVVGVFLFLVFLFLLFFSPKYRWRHLKHELFGGTQSDLYKASEPRLARDG